jgi:predicted aspartyl protease
MYRSPTRNPRDLKLYGPRLEIKVGPPLLRNSAGELLVDSRHADSRFSTMPALIDTGAQRTVLSQKAVNAVGLSKINETELRGVGGVVPNVGVYVASIQFPRSNFATIEVLEISCCELSHPLIECLLGRDVLSRWGFTYDGPDGSWKITEEGAGQWVEPPEGFDVWGK